MTALAAVAVIQPDAAVQREKQRVVTELQQLRSDLLLSQPFVAVLAMRLHLIVVADDRLATACTDSQRVFFNLDFIKSCSTSQKKFVLAHEVWHCVMGHFIRRQDREPLRWNYACDFEVNGILQHYFKGDDMPGNVLFSHSFSGKSAEQIYQILGRSAADQWHETYILGGKSLPTDEAQFDQHHPELADTPHSAIRLDPDYQPQPVTERDLHRWREYTAAAAQVTGVLAGQQSSVMQRVIKNVLSPQLSWPSILQRFIQRTISGSYSWHRPARRYIGQGLYLPGRQGKKLHISLAIDTSGSTLADLPQFLAEMSSMLRHFEQVRLQVISCDAAVTDVSYYENNDLPALVNWQAKGGGGTDFRPVFAYLQHEQSDAPPQALIFFTDGYGSAPAQAPQYPVIWVLTGQGRQPANWGEVLALS